MANSCSLKGCKKMARPPIILTNTLLFSLSGLVALVAVPWYGMSYGYDLWQWATFLLLFCLSGLSMVIPPKN